MSTQTQYTKLLDQIFSSLHNMDDNLFQYIEGELRFEIDVVHYYNINTKLTNKPIFPLSKNFINSSLQSLKNYNETTTSYI